MAPGDDRPYLEPEVETMPRPAIEADQEARLLELVPYWYERSGLLRETWQGAGVHPRDIGSLSDFRERVPFLDKQAIRDFRDRHGDPFGGILCVDRSELTGVFSSSGTTGDPTLFPERWRGWSNLNVARARAMWGVGIRPGDTFIPSPPATFRGPGHQLAHMSGAIPIIVDCWVGNWPAVFDAIERHRPAYMALSKPQLLDLVPHAETHDLRELFSSFKGVGFAGEPLGRVLRSRMQDDWGMDVYLWTNTGDVGVAFECAAHDGCHMWEDVAMVECLEPEGRDPVAEGEVGELVVTALDDLVAPLVRFRSDDLVRTSTRTCACGRTHARQWPVGRQGDRTVVAGRSVMPTDVWSVLEQVPETANAVFQIVRPSTEMAQLRIRVGYRLPDHGVDDLEDEVASRIHEAVGVRPVLELFPEDELLARGTAATKTIPRVVAR